MFPDIPLKQMRYSALIREVGGVGYYPTSGIPFVHVDTGPVRAWPRLPRYELALLFPNGKTKHKPADGDSITKDDVRIARARHKELADAGRRLLRDPQSSEAGDRDRRGRCAGEAPPSPGPQGQPPRRRCVAARRDRVASSSEFASPARRRRSHRSRCRARRSSCSAPRPASPPPSEAERGRLNALVTLASLTPSDIPAQPPPAAGTKAIAASSTPASAPPSVDAPASATAGRPSHRAREDDARRRCARAPPGRPGAPLPTRARPTTGCSDGWAPAPEFDEDHPEGAVLPAVPRSRRC